MATYLDEIVAWHRRRAERDPRTLAEARAEVSSVGQCRPFAAALKSSPSLAVIAEIKRRSPSRGDLAANLDPASLATAYRDGGASCLSVLTDSEHFGGSIADLRAARAAVDLPVLRKDFTVDSRDVCDARAAGADCVLLIAAVLSDRELDEFTSVARDVGIEVLVEVHDEREIERALVAGASLVGVNQRDLVTFEVDHQRALRLAAAIPAEIVTVAESGVRGRDDALSLCRAGYDAVLVGEHLVTASDPAASVRDLLVEC